MTRSLLIAAALLLPLPAFAQNMEVLSSGHPIATVRVEGSAPKRFIIDTGAGTTAILPRMRADLPATVATTRSSLNGASGAMKVESVKIGRLEVEGRSFAITAALFPPSPIDPLGVDGVLGTDVIADFAMEMDMPGRRWRLAPRADAAMLAGLPHSVPFTLDDQRAPRLTIRLNGVEVPALLDTGARGTILNWAAARAIGLTPDSPGLVGGSKIRGTSAHATASVAALLESLSIGDAVIRAPKVHIADLPIFGVIGFTPDQPAVILGIDMFAERRFVVDHPGLRLHLSDPANR